MTPTQIKKDAINDLIFEIERSIVPKYYDFETKKIIHINLEKIDSNYDEEPLFDEYIYSKIKQEIDTANQLDLEPYSNSTYDLRANITIIRQPDATLKILSRYSDAETGKIFYSNQNTYQIVDFDLSDFSNFKNEYIPEDIKKKNSRTEREAFISVNVIYQGDSYKAEDKYYLMSRDRAWGATDYIIKQNTGSSGYYPVNTKCKIDNNIYYPNANHTFFEGRVSPGPLNFTASFQGGFWDGYNREEQVLTNAYSKDFVVNVRPNDNLKIDIICAYNGKKRAMRVIVNRVRKVFVNGVVSEQLKIIEVY